MNHSVNSERIQERIDHLSQIGRLHDGGITRLSLSEEDKKARVLLSVWFEEIGLDLRIDAIGNMFGILNQGKDKPLVGCGSHLDSVPGGGFFDGPLGVVAAIETAERIKELNLELPFNFVVCNFTNEEGARFTPGMMGSKAHADPEDLDKLLSAIDEHGITVKQALQTIGFKGEMNPGTLQFEAFLEIHIEQGPRLESAGKDIGIVNGVQAIRWLELTILGSANHAGTTPINHRKDAFYALTELSRFVRQRCTELEPLVVTLGRVRLEPNTPNIIPGFVTSTLDIRHPDSKICKDVIAEIKNFIDQEHCFNGLKTEIKTLTKVDNVAFDTEVVRAIEKGTKKAGLTHQKMYSGAGHDAQLMARHCASAMIFIPSRYGISHSKEEYSSPQQVVNGCQTVFNSILALADMK